MVHNI